MNLFDVLKEIDLSSDSFVLYPVKEGILGNKTNITIRETAKQYLISLEGAVKKNFKVFKTVVPYKEIQEIYNRTLKGKLRQSLKLSKDCEKFIHARWHEKTEYQSLEFWEGYFNKVLESKYLTDKDSNWHPDLEWLVRPNNFAKVMDGKYNNKNFEWKYPKEEKSTNPSSETPLDETSRLVRERMMKARNDQ